MVKGNETLQNNKKALMLYQELYKTNILSLVVLVVLFAIFLSIANGILFLPIYGHPNPLSYEPRPNQLIDSIQKLPDKVDITFTERPYVS